MKIIAVVGKTASGKDTVAKYIENTYSIKPIVSYTTREKRVCEVNGREHFFVTDKEMDQLIADKNALLAYAPANAAGIRYCATTANLPGETFVYIINPKALQEMKQNHKELEVIEIALYLDESVIRKRAKARGDDETKIDERLDAERAEFDDYMENGTWDIKINTKQKKKDVCNTIHRVLYENGIYTESEVNEILCRRGLCMMPEKLSKG